MDIGQNPIIQRLRAMFYWTRKIIDWEHSEENTSNTTLRKTQPIVTLSISIYPSKFKRKKIIFILKENTTHDCFEGIGEAGKICMFHWVVHSQLMETKQAENFNRTTNYTCEVTQPSSCGRQGRQGTKRKVWTCGVPFCKQHTSPLLLRTRFEETADLLITTAAGAAAGGSRRTLRSTLGASGREPKKHALKLFD